MLSFWTELSLGMGGKKTEKGLKLVRSSGSFGLKSPETSVSPLFSSHTIRENPRSHHSLILFVPFIHEMASSESMGLFHLMAQMLRTVRNRECEYTPYCFFRASK